MSEKIKKLFEKFMDLVNGSAAPAAAMLLVLSGVTAQAAIAPDRISSKYHILTGAGVAGNGSYKLDIGLGASNPGLSYTHSDTSLTLNKPILRFGSGAASNQILEADIGSGATNPKIRWNNSTLEFEIAEDGTNYYSLGQEGGTASAISASDIDWSAKNPIYTKTLSANTTFTFSNQSVKTIVVRVTNTASNYTVTWPAAVKWSGGTTPVQTVGAKADVYTFVYDGTTTFGSYVQDFTP